jgi:hypothetical protein
MSARVTTTVRTEVSSPPGVITESGQAFIVGQAVRGPVVPTRVFGIADYRAIFGDRTGATDLFDVVQTAFKEGLGSAYILRAVGPGAVKATIGLDSNKIVVTAKEFGAWGNAMTATYTSASKTLTVKKADGSTVTYTGTTAAELQTAASVDPDVTVTVSSLPASNVAETSLATGTDDYANVVPATTLALLDGDLGDGAVVWAVKHYATVGAALQTHCEDTDRLGIATLAAGTSQSAAISALASASGANLVCVWPHTTVNSGGATLTVAPTGLALGARARAHGQDGAWASPIRDIYGTAQYVTGVEVESTAAEWQTLNAGNVSVVRTVNGVPRLYGWRLLSGATNLRGAQFRDTINRVAVGCGQVAEQYVGVTVDGKGRRLAEFAGDLTGFLANMGGAFFAGPNDPGYVVDVGPGVNSTASLAAGNLKASVGVRLAPTAEFVFIDVVATDAAGAI